MKRKTLKSIACAAIMALALSATACGSKDAANTEDNANVEDAASTEDTAATEDEADTQEAEPTEAPEAADETGAETETEDEADTTDAATGDYATLEDFYNDPSVKSVLDSAFESMAGEGMALSIDVKENTLTMICKFTDESLDTTGMGEALDAALETQEETFKTQASTFDDAIGQTGACTVVVRYTDANDNVLTEKEYKAQ